MSRWMLWSSGPVLIVSRCCSLITRPCLPQGFTPFGDDAIQAACARSIEQVASAVEATNPRLLMHGRYHHRYAGLFGLTRTGGLASDEQSARQGESWVIFELPSLAVVRP